MDGRWSAREVVSAGGGRRGRWSAREVVGTGVGWHRKCEWAAEQLQVVVAQEM